MNGSRFGLYLTENLMKQRVGFAIIQLSMLKKWGLVPYSFMHKGKIARQQRILIPYIYCVLSRRTFSTKHFCTANKKPYLYSDNFVVPVSATKTEIR